jgi:uncharacterized protein YfaP (DUF2135 family)
MFLKKERVDLDLYVIDPNGEKIYWNHKNSNIGGQLNIDMRTESNALEVITFNAANKSSIVNGTYTCLINYFFCNSQYFNSCGSPINYLVSILTGPSTWKYFTGSLSTWDSGTNLTEIYSFTI